MDFLIDELQINTEYTNSSNIVKSPEYYYFQNKIIERNDKIFYTLFYCSIFLSIIVIIYISFYKWKHKFWYNQPVQHYHNIFSYLYNFKHITKNLDTYINKLYLDETNILWTFAKNFNTKESNTLFEHILELVKTQYWRETSNYIPSEGVLKSYFKEHKNDYYASIYVQDNEPIGCITSRPIHLWDNKYGYKHDLGSIQYVDFLTVSKKYRNQQIAPKLIQTMVYHFSQKYNNIPCVFLFKHEIRNAPYKHIIDYSMYNYTVTDIIPDISLNNINKIDIVERNIDDFQLIKITHTNIIQYFDNIFSLLQKQFKIIFHNNKYNIQQLLKQNTWLIYCITKNDKVHGLFIYQNTETYDTYTDYRRINKFMSKKPNKLYFQLYTSCFDTSFLSNKNIKHFFFVSLREIYNYIFNNYRSKITDLLIDNISQNILLTNLLENEKIQNKFVVPIKYYVYNMFCKKFNPHDVFICI